MISILYVDDEVDLLLIGKRFLEKSGDFTVDTCASAIEALQILHPGLYDGIVSDYQMPGMDGIEFLKKVRSTFGDLPFILFTGKGREEVVIEAINSGVDFYIQKGGDPRAQFAELTHKIKRSVDRNQVMVALAKNEERMRFALEGANEALWDNNFSTGELFISPRGCEMLGYTPEEIQKYAGQEWNTLIHPDDIPVTNSTLHTYCEGKSEYFQVEQRIRMKSGEWKWVLLRGKVAEYDENNQPVRFVGTHTDITEQKKAEAALKENRDYLSQIFSSVKEGIVIIDAQTHEILDVNPAAVQMIGAERDEILHKICHSYICPACSGTCPITDLHQMVDNSERVLITTDGRKIPIIKYVVPFNLQGRECLLETFIDNSDRNIAQEKLLAAYEQISCAEEELRSQLNELTDLKDALEKSEAKFRTIVETSPDVIWEIEPDGTLSYVSPRSIDILGYTPEELVGKSILSLIPQESVETVKNVLSNVDSQKPGLIILNAPVFHRDGHPLIINSRSYPLFNREGTFVGFRGTGTDVTERKKAGISL